MWGQRLDLALLDEDVELRIEAPEKTPAFDEFAGKNADAFNGARRKVGADRQHRSAS